MQLFKWKMSRIYIKKGKFSKFYIFFIFLQLLPNYRKTLWTRMLKPLNNEKVVVSVSFQQQIRTISNSKVLEIDLEVVEKVDDFVVFDAIFVHVPKVFVINSITLNNERTSYAIHFLKKTLQSFASKTPTFFLLSTSSFLSKPCLHFEAFWIQNDGRGSTRIERLFHSAFREKLFSNKMKYFTR